MDEVDVAVVGAGLAGLTAATEAAGLNARTTVFAGPAPGGLLLSIENVEGLPDCAEGIAGYDLCPLAHEAAMDAGAHFVSALAGGLAFVGGAWQVQGEGHAVLAKAVVLAPGASLRPLGIDGELRLAGRGVSHCASCDGPLLRGRTVAVVGGGDAACQEALTLARFASRVHLLVRGAALRARASWMARVAQQDNIQIHLNAAVRRIEGESAVSGVTLGDGRQLALDAVFVYAGLVPATQWLAGIVALDARGGIVTAPDLSCSVPGAFAAGVARSGHSGQAADARAEGQAAGRAAAQYRHGAAQSA